MPNSVGLSLCVLVEGCGCTIICRTYHIFVISLNFLKNIPKLDSVDYEAACLIITHRVCRTPWSKIGFHFGGAEHSNK